MSPAPLAFTITLPPPEEASTSCLARSSWIWAIFFCALAAALIILAIFMGIVGGSDWVKVTQEVAPP